MSEKLRSNVIETVDSAGVRISVLEIAQRLKIGRQAVYSMLEQRIIPGIRLGRRWIITRQAYQEWERSCGTVARAGLQFPPEVTVLD